MVHILLATHCGLASAFKETARMVLGDKRMEFVHAVGIYEESGIEKLEEEVRHVKQSLNGEPVLILTDIFGASPFNVCLQIFRDYDYHIVTGLNLPMLIELLMCTEYADLKELAELVDKNGKSGIISFKFQD